MPHFDVNGYERKRKLGTTSSNNVLPSAKLPPNWTQMGFCKDTSQTQAKLFADRKQQ